MAASAESPDTGPRAGQGRVRVAISSDNINGNADGSSTISPSLELLPPSPTHSLSLLGPDEDSDTEELPEAFRPPSRLAEIAAFCAGKASVRSREREHAREREREDEAAAFALALARGEPSPASLASPVSPASPASALLAPRSPLSPGWSRTPVSPLSDVSDAPGPVPSPTLSIGSVGSVGSAGTGKGASRWWPRISGQPRNRISLSVGQHAREPFAADVAVRGWQVVGGKSWTGGGKVGAYVVYEIDITMRAGTTVSILRRYTEFVRLRDDLHRAFPHLRQTIPALPGKNHMSKFSPEFLEERRPRLQRFLRTVMLHPEMGVGGEDSVIGRWVVMKR